MADIQITYETLFDLLRRERNRDEIQPLDASFYADVLAYMAEKQSLMGSLDDMTAEAEKARIQFQNIKKIIKELYDRREKKLVLLALNTVRTGSTTIDKSGFLPEEQLFFNDLLQDFSKHRREVLETVLRQAAPFGGATPVHQPPKQEETSHPKQEEEPPAQPTTDDMTIKFLKPVPRFAGGGEQVFGPFNKGEEASLPAKIAVVLVKKGRAERVT